MTDPLTTATRIRDALTAYIDAAEALPPEVRALLLRSSDAGDMPSLAILPWRSTTDTGPSPWTVTTADEWVHIKVEAPKAELERSNIVKPYRIRMWHPTAPWNDGKGAWVSGATFLYQDSAEQRANMERRHQEKRGPYTRIEVIDRRTEAVVWEWVKDVDPPTDNP